MRLVESLVRSTDIETELANIVLTCVFCLMHKITADLLFGVQQWRYMKELMLTDVWRDLLGLESNRHDSVAYELLIPLSTIQNYIRLVSCIFLM